MRRFGLILCVVVAMGVFSVVVVAAEEEATDARTAKLCEALWKERPSDIEVTLYKEVARRPKSREEVVKSVDKLYESFGKDADKVFGDITREQQVASRMKSPDNVRVSKEHTVVKGENQIVERTYVKEGNLGNEGYEEVLGNVAASNGSERCSYTIDNVRKQATLQKSTWKDAHYDDMGTFSRGSVMGLKFMIGDLVLGEDGRPAKDANGMPVMVPDAEKMAMAFSAEGESPVRLAFVEGGEVEGRATVALETRIKTEEGPERTVARWVLDSEDYSVCYREEGYDPVDGSLKLLCEASEFKETGGEGRLYPRVASRTEYASKGVIEKCEAYAIEAVEFDTGVSDEFFAFKVPDDYTVADFRYGEPIISQPAEVAADVIDMSAMDAEPEVVEETAADASAERAVESAAEGTAASDESEKRDEGGGEESSSTAVIIGIVCALAAAGVLVAVIVMRKRNRA